MSQIEASPAMSPFGADAVANGIGDWEVNTGRFSFVRFGVIIVVGAAHGPLPVGAA